jgi:cytoskeletal protein CcmA (bactofilin family)
MFASRQRGTLIAKGLKIVGSVTAEGLVEVKGLRSMEPLQPNAWLWMEQSKVRFTAVTSFQAHVVGDVQHQSLTIEGEPILMGVRCKCE